GDLRRAQAVGDNFRTIAIKVEAKIEKRSVSEVLLVSNHAEMALFGVAGRGAPRRKRGQPGKFVVLNVVKIAGRQHIGRREIDLQFGDVAGAPERIEVGPTGQFGNDDVVVLAFDAFEEPHFPLDDGPGDGHTRNDLVKVQPLFNLCGWEKVGGGVAQLVVTDAGFDAEHAARAFAVLHRYPAALDVNDANGVGADSQQKQSIGG